jgi:hypothetical protein
MDFDLGGAQNEAQSHPVDCAPALHLAEICRLLHTSPALRRRIGDYPEHAVRKRLAMLVCRRRGYLCTMTGEGVESQISTGGQKDCRVHREKFSGGQ